MKFVKYLNKTSVNRKWLCDSFLSKVEWYCLVYGNSTLQQIEGKTIDTFLIDSSMHIMKTDTELLSCVQQKCMEWKWFEQELLSAYF